MAPRLYSIRDAAKRLSISVTTLRNHSQTRSARQHNPRPFYRVPGLARVLVDVDAYLAWLVSGGAKR